MPRSYGEATQEVRASIDNLENAVKRMFEGVEMMLDRVAGLTLEMQMYGIKEALTEYHHALDTRQHGGVAQDKFTHAVEKILDMHWVQGATLKKSAESVIPSRESE